MKYLNKGLEDKKAGIEKLQKQSTELKAKQAILIEKNIQGIINDELCKEQIALIDENLYKINTAIKNIPQTKINYTQLISMIRDFILNPGDVWERANFKDKIKLQWFYFPHGIEFDGHESRTSKICKLFKLQELFSPYLSSDVHYLNFNSNTSNPQIPLRYEPNDTKVNLEDEIFWQQLGEEIAYLANLTAKNSKVNASQSN